MVLLDNARVIFDNWLGLAWYIASSVANKKAVSILILNNNFS